MVEAWPVIATKGRSDWLKRQLGLLVPQLHGDERIVVVCDGDADAVHECERMEFVLCIPLAESRGPDGSRRIGNALVPTDAVVCEIDDHDLAEPCLLSEVRSAFEDESILIAYSNVKYADPSGEIGGVREKPSGTFRECGHLGWGFRAYRKWAYDCVGGYPMDAYPANDYALLCRIEQLGGTGCTKHIETPLCTVCMDVTGISEQNKAVQQEQVERVANVALGRGFDLPFALTGQACGGGGIIAQREWTRIRHIQFSLCTCVRNRVEHVRKTIPAALATPARQVVVCDYGSTDGGREYLLSINDPKLVILDCEAIKDDPWNYSRAMNTAGDAACKLGANCLGFFDCDVILKPEWVRSCGFTLAEGFAGVRPDDAPPGCGWTGTQACRADVFREINGYDESLPGWGAQDTDFARRISDVGKIGRYSASHVSHIDHGDDMRADRSQSKQNRLKSQGRSTHVANGGGPIGCPAARMCGTAEPKDYEGAGVLYIATGDRHITMARWSIASLRLWCPGIPVVTVGFQAEDCESFTPPMEPGWNARGWKTSMFDLSPFDRTLFLDADTVVNGDVAPALAVLDEADVAVAHDTSASFESDFHLSDQDRAWAREELHDAWPQYNTGVIAFRKSDAAKRLFDAWHSDWQREGQKDQGAFARACARAGARIHALAINWNGPRDGSIIWHRMCEGLCRRLPSTVIDEADLYERTRCMPYLRGR